MRDDYQVTLSNLIEKINLDQIDVVSEMIRDTRGLVYIVGNGGSASNAEHFANDLMKVAGIRAIAITSVAPLTAYSNDESYEQSFAGPASVLLRPDDTVIALSVSGTSPNIISVIEEAHSIGATIVMMTGIITPNEHPHTAFGLADCCIEVVSANFGIVETVHQAVCHIIADTIKEIS